jgi:hypothetical protein
MPEKNHQNQQDNTPKKVEAEVSGKVSVSYDPKPFADIVHAISEANTTQTQEEEVNNRQNGRQADAQERANTISNRLFWVNLFMLAITICVFRWNIIGVEAATKAATAAIRADSISSAAFKWDSTKSVKSSFDDSIKFKKQFDLADSSLKAQISYIKETQKEFNAQNRPFVDITDVKIDMIDEGQKPRIRFRFSNTGKFPAQIFKYAGLVKIGPESVEGIIVKNKHRGTKIVNQIISTYPMYLEMTSTREEEMTYIESNNFKNGAYFFYWLVDITYMDYISKIKYKRSIIYKISNPPPTSTDIISEKEIIY